MVSLLGMLWQVTNLSQMYFKYDTVTELRLEWPKTFLPPSLSYCVANLDLKYENASVKFNYLPPVETFFNQCQTHHYDWFGFYNRRYGANCGRYFKVRKFIKQRLLCYSIHYSLKRFDYDKISNEFDAPLYNVIYINHDFQKSEFNYYAMKAHGHRFYGLSKSVLEVAKLSDDNGSTFTLGNSFTFSYNVLISHRLNAPYRTNCHNYTIERFESQDHCYDHCLTKTMVRDLKM